jgi:hypothetical protein
MAQRRRVLRILEKQVDEVQPQRAVSWVGLQRALERAENLWIDCHRDILAASSSKCAAFSADSRLASRR